MEKETAPARFESIDAKTWLRTLLPEDEFGLVEKASAFGDEYFQEESIVSWCEDGDMPDEVMQAYKDVGLGYLGLSKSLGGPSASFLTQMAVLEELSRIAGTVLPMQSQMLSFNILSRFADDEQKSVVLERFEETARSCFSTAFSDVYAASNIADSKTTVEDSGGKLLLNGGKNFVNNGMFSPYVLVMARNLASGCSDGEAPISIWLIPRDIPGITVYPIEKVGQKMRNTAVVLFEDVELDPSWRLGGRDLSKEDLFFMMDLGRTVVCANSLGMAQAAVEEAVPFAASHVVDGRPIGAFQQIGQMVTNMQLKMLNMRHLVYDGARSIDSGKDTALMTALMKAYVPYASEQVANDAMQIIGGMGYARSSRVSRIWIDCRGNRYATGTDQIACNLAAHEILKAYSR